MKNARSPPQCGTCEARSHCLIGAIKMDPRTQGFLSLWADPGETIFTQGTPSAGGYILCSGLAKLVRRTGKGQKYIIRVCRSGELLNPTLDGEHQVSAVAIKPCSVGVVPRAALVTWLRSQPEVFPELLRRFAIWEALLLRRIEGLVSFNVRERLVHMLVELAEEHGVQEDAGLRIDLPLTQQDLADLVGASRQTICQELQRLVNKGLVRVEARRMILTERKGPRRSG